MSSFVRWIIIAVWVSNVQARNETLIHGWRSEPQGRGTWSILWSCLATIFISTWSALHLNVPKRHGRSYLLFRKIRWMLLAVVAPEAILAHSASHFFKARDLLKRISKGGNQEWTLTHMQFAIARGFYTRTQEGGKSKCDIEQLTKYIKTKSIDGPPITEKELQARGKSDLMIKLIALFQIIWFAVQTLLRSIQHYQITALEIMTVAFVFCTVFTYGMFWYQPQNVEYPVVLEIRNVAPATDGTTPDQNRDWLVKDMPIVLLGFFACGFGALHCLAWDSPFPTSKEKLAWRICSVTTTVLPALYTPFALYVESHELSEMAEAIVPWVHVLFFVPYALGRATLVVLAFTALRILPADAFQTVNWNNYLPHFAG